MVKNNIFSSTLVFGVLTFIQPALQFFLLPIYLKYLSPEDYGIYSLMNNTTFLITVIAGLRIFSAIFPFYYKFKYSEKRSDEFFSQVLSFTIVTNILLFAIFIITGDFIFQFIFKSNQIRFFPFGIIAISTGLLQSIIACYTILIKNQKKLIRFGLLQLCVILVTVISQIALIVFLDFGLYGALMGKLIAMGFGVLIVLFFAYKLVTISFKKYYIIQSLKFSLPLIPFLLINWAQRFGDKFVFERFIDLETVGIYSLLSTIILLVSMGSDALTNAFQPFLFEYYHANDSHSRSKIKSIYKLYTSIMLVAASLVIFIGTNIGLFTTQKKFLSITDYVGLGVLVVFMSTYIQLFRINLIYKKKSGKLSFYTTISAVVLFTLYFLLIPEHKIYGALISTLIGNILLTVLLFYENRRIYGSLLAFKELFAIPLLSFSVLGALYWYMYQSGSIVLFSYIQLIIMALLVLISNRSDLGSYKKLLLSAN